MNVCWILQFFLSMLVRTPNPCLVPTRLLRHVCTHHLGGFLAQLRVPNIFAPPTIAKVFVLLLSHISGYLYNSEPLIGNFYNYQ